MKNNGFFKNFAENFREIFLVILCLLLILILFLWIDFDSEQLAQENQKTFEKYAEDTLQLCTRYDLVSVQISTPQPQVTGNLSGSYLFGIGTISGNIDTVTTPPIYKYWYKREDGGILPETIDMSIYENPDLVKIVIYEDNTTNPKLEIWRNQYAIDVGDGEFENCGEYGDIFAKTEFRFTIPEGTFVNTFDLQELY